MGAEHQAKVQARRQAEGYDYIEVDRTKYEAPSVANIRGSSTTKKVKYDLGTKGRMDEWNLFLSQPEGQKFLSDVDPNMTGRLPADAGDYISEGATYEAVGVKKINAEEVAVGTGENKRRMKGAKDKRETAAAVAGRSGGVRNILSGGASGPDSNNTLLGGGSAAKTLLGI
jgi:hypothetical protein